MLRRGLFLLRRPNQFRRWQHSPGPKLDGLEFASTFWLNMYLRMVRFPVVLGACLFSLSSDFQSAFAQLQITVLNPSLSSFQVGWSALDPTNAYTVQYRDGLGDAIWLNAPHTAPWPISVTQWTDPRTSPASQRFYRVLAVESAQRGQLLTNTTLASYSQGTVAFMLGYAQIPVTAEYGVNVIKLRYETIDPWGGRTIASGLLGLPQEISTNLPLVSYQHGTLVATNEAPSVTVTSLSGEGMLSIVMATSGYAVVVPDYLGLGDSPPLHQYHHARSEATACVDMLRAARAYCASNGVTLSGKLFLAGYSQGGHVTMALHREIEEFHTNEFTITASAPMAGAYDLSGTTLDDFLSDRPKPNPYYYAYLVAAYQAVYHLAPSLADMLTPPYDTTLPPLFHGNAIGDEINTNMPPDPRQILKSEYLTALQVDSNNPFRVALRDHDLYNWAPRAPMRLYHCGGDQDVLIANSEIATNVMHSLGATNVTLVVTSPTLDHGDCAQPSLLNAKTWFDTLK